MKLRPEHLKSHLQQGLQASYLVSGDEPLLVQEASDAIRAHAREAGFSESQRFAVDARFAWENFIQLTAQSSLFADQQLLILDMPSGKPGTMGSKTLQTYLENPDPNTCLLIITGKLSGAAAGWLKALNKHGVHLPVWPVDAKQLPGWIGNRLREKGLTANADITQLLAERVEGNLLAAAQEIEKLALLQSDKPLSEEAMLAAITDSARFNVFTLVDSALMGEQKRALRILMGLKAEGLEPILVLWALAREIRQLANISFALSQGHSAAAAMQQEKVWDSRRPLLQQALKRQPATPWPDLLRYASHIDQLVKGVVKGHVWDALSTLTLALAGVSVRQDNNPSPQPSPLEGERELFFQN